jgi:hypothetical protein
MENDCIEYIVRPLVMRGSRELKGRHYTMTRTWVAAAFPSVVGLTRNGAGIAPLRYNPRPHRGRPKADEGTGAEFGMETEAYPYQWSEAIRRQGEPIRAIGHNLDVNPSTILRLAS